MQLAKVHMEIGTQNLLVKCGNRPFGPTSPHRPSEEQPTQTHSLTPNTTGNLAWPIHLTCTILDCGRKPEHPEETHADTRSMCKHHTDSCLRQELNPGLWRCEAAVLTTATVPPTVFSCYSSAVGYDDYSCGHGSGSSYGYSGKSWDSYKGNQTSESIVAKINQQLDLLSRNEGDDQERFAPFESYDSRSSLDDRELFRSGFDCSESGPNRNDYYGDRFDHFSNSVRNRRNQFYNRARDRSGQQWGQNWSRDRPPSNRPFWNNPFSSYSSSERLSAHWNELSIGYGGRGYGPLSRNVPSLFSQPSGFGMFGMQGVGKQFGGGRLRRRERNQFRIRGGRGREIGFGRKRQPSTASNDEPDSKLSRMDQSDISDSEAEGKEQVYGDDVEGSARGDSCANFEEKDATDTLEKEKKESDADAGEGQEESNELKMKMKPRKKQRDRITERILYACSVCKFRTFDDEEIFPHLESKFHKENFKFIGTKLPKETAEFLHEYVLNKNKKTLKFRDSMEDKSAIIKRIQEQNLLHGISIENFMKKVEAVHCIACEMFIPMQNNAIQRHMKTFDHNRNRKMMLEQSKKTSLQVAKSILNNRNIVTMLDKYLKGENPFTEEDAKENEDGIDDPLEGDAGENDEVKKDETTEGEQAEIKLEPGEESAEGDGKIVNADQTIVDKSEQGADATDEEGEANLTGDQNSEESLPAEETAEVAVSAEDKVLEAGDGENPDESTESPSGGGDAEKLE
ncbi:A-kinase anchor protein 8-like isoform X2 [Chiloscyllium punctatum]|uniref:A-kinase anchor protein 8-like isoform X2 n=1 Tax=Chiloscyllium punctatum TaxID=137246 RepID=UPI003B642505